MRGNEPHCYCNTRHNAVDKRCQTLSNDAVESELVSEHKQTCLRRTNKHVDVVSYFWALWKADLFAAARFDTRPPIIASRRFRSLLLGWTQRGLTRHEQDKEHLTTKWGYEDVIILLFEPRESCLNLMRGVTAATRPQLSIGTGPINRTRGFPFWNSCKNSIFDFSS